MRVRWHCSLCARYHPIGESHLQALARESRSRKPEIIVEDKKWRPTDE